MSYLQIYNLFTIIQLPPGENGVELASASGSLQGLLGLPPGPFPNAAGG